MFPLQRLCIFSIFSAGVLATFPPHSKPPGPEWCMSSSDALQVATTWTQLIGNYTKELAQDTLTANYTDYSESALSLNNVCPQAPVASPPLTYPVFTNRTQFEGGQGMQLPIESKILQVWQSCTTVTMRWELTNTTNGGRPVIGIIVLETVEVSLVWLDFRPCARKNVNIDL